MKWISVSEEAESGKGRMILGAEVGQQFLIKQIVLYSEVVE